MSQDVCIRSLSQEQEQEAERASQIQECQENKCSGAEERTKNACSPQKQLLSLLSSCPPHQLTQLQQTSPMLSSTINLPIETVSQQGMPPGREGSRCLTRQKQVASYSRASVMTAATTTMLRAARVTRVTRMAYSPGLPR
jgi:hypothetical protein